MLVLGTLSTVALAAYHTKIFGAACSGSIEMTASSTAVASAYLIGEILAMFGAVCVDSGEARTLCGAGGHDGGVAMAVIGGILLSCAIVGFLALAHAERRYKIARHAGAIVSDITVVFSIGVRSLAARKVVHVDDFPLQGRTLRVAWCVPVTNLEDWLASKPEDLWALLLRK